MNRIIPHLLHHHHHHNIHKTQTLKFLNFLKHPLSQLCQLHSLSTYHHYHASTTNQTLASMQTISSNQCYQILSICKNVNTLKQIHAFFILNGLPDDLLVLTKMVSLYGSYGNLGYARKVFEGIPNPDMYSFKVMIRWYFLNDMYGEIIGFYRCLRRCLRRESDDVVFSEVLKACCELRDVVEGRKVHCDIVKVGSFDGFVLNGLVDMYGKCGDVGSAYGVFEEIEVKNVVSWSSLISGCVQNDCPEEGLRLFSRMRESFVYGNHFTLVSLIKGCGKMGALHQGKWFHGYLVKTGIGLNSFLASSLLDMYAKCGSVDDARRVFDESSVVDVVSWTAMIVGYTQSGRPDKALKLFSDKRQDCFLPNSETIATVLSACAQLEDFRTGRLLHSLATVRGLVDAAVKHALIDMYAKCRMMDNSRYIFESISRKDVISWNSIISGYSQNGFAHEALQLFHQMRLNTTSSDAVTVASIMTACASMSAVGVGSSLHACFIKEGLSCINTYVSTAILNFYAKCGDAISARKVFDEMGDKNEVTWSSMIRSYGMLGESENSFALFNDMLRENVDPNEAIFTAVLSACSHTGKVGEGWKYFASMCQEYNFVPSMKHYACMVDILSRAGKLEEAVGFIENMPIQPDMSVLGAFVHGCSLHSQLGLGEIAAKRMLDMHPNEACYYVLLLNLYASDGRWDKANEIRDLMKQRGLSKSPGWSSTEMDMGDQSHSLQVSSIR